MKKLPLLTGVCLWLSLVVPAAAQSNPAAEQSLRELRQAANPPAFSKPAPGQKKPKEKAEAEVQAEITRLVGAAAKAREYQTSYPSDPSVAEARKLEVNALLHAVRIGASNRESEALQLADAFVADQRNDRRDQFLVASAVKQWKTQKQGHKEKAAEFAAYEKNAAELYAAFSDVPDVYYLFLGLARNAPAAKARQIATDLLTKPAPAEVLSAAQAVIDRLDLPGKTLPLEFGVNDGTRFELSKHKGTPVVLYVWASWGTASAKAMPTIRAAAAEKQAIFVGVNLDPSPLAQNLAPDGEPPPGPQHWTPVGFNGELPRQLKVDRVPSVYVFDAEGVLRGFGPPSELNALLAAAGVKNAKL